ncbi:Transcriptional regulatory protein YycF [Mycolicibacterium chlorophenolicum]|uniref:Transcriptional regulatory protein YycF n=2 Tax=Mycolicibacterium chlorophenolicum TaxID=37916 RepID=A0A0J6YNP9_9MYCO|nr:Transcriptional regulatory protein YycF [Mycolicibacterium chlorophenolicum]
MEQTSYVVVQYNVMRDRLTDSPIGVLVIDDDTRWIDIVAAYIRRGKVSLAVADDAQDGLAAADMLRPSMIIFSLDLTDIDTLNMCRGLRATGDAHIIAMARRCDKDTTDLALAAGADEVLAKPSSGRSMAARTRAVLRVHLASRRTTPSSGELADRRVFGPLSVNLERREVFVADEQVKLTRTQFEILATLAQRAGAVTSRQQLIDSVWGPSWTGSPNNIDVHIGQLRRRLGDDPARPLLVLSVRGKGFRLAR